MTVITLDTTTPVPVKTEAMDWDCFANDIVVASETEETRLLQVIPTPKLTAERGTDEWNEQYLGQRRAGSERTKQLQQFQARLIVAIAEALEAEVAGFSELSVEYAGSGDGGEEGDINVGVDFIGEPTTPCETFKGRLLYSQEQRDERNRNQEYADALLPTELTEWLDETVWAIAYHAYPGFEIDAGGYGSLTAARDEGAGKMTLSLTHTQRVEESYEPLELV